MDIPYPADTRAKGWRFELDHERIQQSDTWALAAPNQRPWLLMLWMVAWQQTPCGSLPDSDELIAARIGMPAGEFQLNRAILLRSWELGDDGRLYHPVIVEKVLEMLARKARETQRKADYRARFKASNVPLLSHGTDMGLTRESSGSDDTGTSTGKRKPSCSPSASELVDDGFANFWERYPKKAAKPRALKEWKKINPAGQVLVELMAGLEKQKVSSDWLKDGGQFIPHPATWLNSRRWEDEIQHVAQASTSDADIFASAV
jgi:hypothetical protein